MYALYEREEDISERWKVQACAWSWSFEAGNTSESLNTALTLPQRGQNVAVRS